jgi:pSer/pThr/pTyr-binding forkhead associated (FHA) protein
VDVANPTLKLIVQEGPTAGAELVLTEGLVTIGREATADLMLTGDEFVSLSHATVMTSALGSILRNISRNGTQVNDQPIAEAVLADGDRIAVGARHILGVRLAGAAGTDRKPAGSGVRVTRTMDAPEQAHPRPEAAKPKHADDQAKSTFNPPLWVKIYLAMMAVVFVVFTVMQVTSAGDPGLKEILASEQGFATARHLAQADTDRVLKLIETAAVHERRGDARSAYEAYREVLGVRQPVDSSSPAYRYAAARMTALGFVK